MNYSWKDLQEMMKDPDFRRRNAKTVGGLIAQASETVPADTSVGVQEPTGNATRGKQNRDKGQALEDEVMVTMGVLWLHGFGMVFNTGPKVAFVGKGQVKYKAQPKGKFDPPQNPPDFMGQLFGFPVGFDAKVSHSSNVYYGTRNKKKKQHEGIVGLAEISNPCGLFGYMIEWEPGKISFISAVDCKDGKVRQDLSTIWGETAEDVIRKWAEGNGVSWPL